jgi:hypothetical protein
LAFAFIRSASAQKNGSITPILGGVTQKGQAAA